MGGKGGGAGGSGSGGVGLARANARLPAAEIQDTRDRAKQLTQELLEVRVWVRCVLRVCGKNRGAWCLLVVRKCRSRWMCVWAKHTVYRAAVGA